MIVAMSQNPLDLMGIRFLPYNRHCWVSLPLRLECFPIQSCMCMLNTETAHMISASSQCSETLPRNSMGLQGALECTHSLHELITEQLTILCLLYYDASLSLFSSSPLMVKNNNLRRHVVPVDYIQVSI